MADPLSVAASIAGLLSLAGQVYTTLDTFISNVQHAPSFANRIRIEVDSFRRSLNALHTLLSSWAAPPIRAALIPADFIVLIFTDATLLFSEIEAEVLPLVQLDNFDFVARSRWTLKKAQLETLVSRLQWQKLTLVLQLNILMWY
jgi:cell division control protein 24